MEVILTVARSRVERLAGYLSRCGHSLAEAGRIVGGNRSRGLLVCRAFKIPRRKGLFVWELRVAGVLGSGSTEHVRSIEAASWLRGFVERPGSGLKRPKPSLGLAC